MRHIAELGGVLDFDAAGHLVGVDLAGDRVSLSDADVPCLTALPHLKQLKLSGAGVTNAGIRQVASLAGLGASRCWMPKSTTPGSDNLPA